MTKKGLYDLIEAKKVELEEELSNSDPDFDRLKEIVEGHNFYKVEDLAKLDLIELFSLILKFENQDQYDYYMENFKERFEKLVMGKKVKAKSQYIISSEFQYLYAIAVSYQIAAKKYLEVNKGEPKELADKFFVDRQDFEHFFGEYKSYKDECDLLCSKYDLDEAMDEVQWLGKLSMFQKGQVSAYDFLVLLYGYIDSYNCIMLGKKIKNSETLKDIKSGNVIYSMPEVNDNFISDDIEDYVFSLVDARATECLKQARDAFHINKIIPAFIKFYNSTLQKNENSTRLLKRKISKYSHLLENFDNILSQKEVVDVAKIVDGLDEDIKTAVLSVIYEHNKTFYDEQNLEYQTLQENEDLQFQLFLKDYGIELGTYDVLDIRKCSLDSIKSFLDKLKEINIFEPDLLVNILKVGNIDAINSSYKYIKRGIISTEFLKENIDFFDFNSNVHSNVMANILSFLDNSFSPNYISSNQDVLLIENSLLSTNLDTIKQYGFSKDIKSDLLKESSLAELFDVIIELGYEDRLEEDLDIASYGRNKWKRIELLKQLGVIIEDSDLEEVLDSKCFFVSDDELDNYIFRVFDETSGEVCSSKDISSDLAVLEQFNLTKRSYDINGVVVSKNKVMRNLGRLNKESVSQQEKLFVSLLSGRSVTKDEYEQVIKAFDVDACKVFSKINCN